MKIAHIALLSLPLFTAACATNPPDGKEEQVAEAKVECEKTYRVGSMMPKKECGPALTQEQRAFQQMELERIRPSASNPGGTSGNGGGR